MGHYSRAPKSQLRSVRHTMLHFTDLNIPLVSPLAIHQPWPPLQALLPPLPVTPETCTPGCRAPQREDCSPRTPCVRRHLSWSGNAPGLWSGCSSPPTRWSCHCLSHFIKIWSNLSSPSVAEKPASRQWQASRPLEACRC